MVGTNVVAHDDVIIAVHFHAVGGVTGDHIARTGCRAANGIGWAVNQDTDIAVGHCGRAGGVGADEVAGHDVGRRAAAAQVDAVGGITRNHVAGPSAGTADSVARRALFHHDAITLIAQAAGAGAIGAEVIALHQVARSSAGLILIVDANARAGVAGNDVRRACPRAADGVVRGAVDRDAGKGIATQGSISQIIGTDQIALDHVRRAGRPLNVNAAFAIGSDDVARPGRRPTDRIAGCRNDDNACAGVAEGLGARGIRADVIAHNEVEGRAVAGEPDAVHQRRTGTAIARDDVAGESRGAADRVVGAVVDVDAGVVIVCSAVGNGGRAAGVGADVIPGHSVVRDILQVNAICLVARNDVASSSHRAAYGIAARTTRDQDTIAAVSQRDGSRGISADVIPLDHRPQASIEDLDSVGSIAGDRVAGAGDRPANDVAGTAQSTNAVERDAKTGVPKRLGAGGVGANEIARDDVSGGVTATDVDHRAAVESTADGDAGKAKVGGDNVPDPGGRAPDRVVRRPGDEHSALDVAQSVGPGGIGADVIICDDVAARVLPVDIEDLDPFAQIARDEVAGGRASAADRVIGRPSIDVNAAERRSARSRIVAQGGRARRVGADEVPLDLVARGAASRHDDPVAAKTVDRKPFHDTIGRADRDSIHAGASAGSIQLDDQGGVIALA